MNRAYLAGFFDGEGCIWLSERGGKRPTFMAAVVNTDRRPLLEFKRRWGGSIHPITDRRPRLKPRIVWRWAASGRAAARAVREMGPYLVVKAPQARVWLRGWARTSARARGEHHPSEDRALARRLSAMKRV